MLVKRGWLRVVGVLGLLMLLLMTLAGPALAVEMRSGEAVTLAKGETVDDDLLLSGTMVVVDGTVNGDLFAVGQDVIINGTVNGSLFAGARTVTLNGKVSGSLYTGAATVILGPTASVGRNAFFGGYSLVAQSGSVIKRDLLVGGGQALLGGEVGRDLKAGLGALELNGKVGRDVVAEVGEPGGTTTTPPIPGLEGVRTIASGLRVGQEAQIGGKLQYRSATEQAARIGAKPAGGVEFTQVVASGSANRGAAKAPAADWSLARVRELVTLLLLGAVALWKGPKLFERATTIAQQQPLPAAGYGLLVALVGYVGAFLSFLVILGLTLFFLVVTLGGLSGAVFGVGTSSLGVAFALFSLAVSYGSKLIVAYLGGQWIAQRLGGRVAESRGWALVIGVLVYVLLRSIPFLGWLVGLAATLVGLGAMWLLYRELRQPPAPTAAA